MNGLAFGGTPFTVDGYSRHEKSPVETTDNRDESCRIQTTVLAVRRPYRQLQPRSTCVILRSSICDPVLADNPTNGSSVKAFKRFQPHLALSFWVPYAMRIGSSPLLSMVIAGEWLVMPSSCRARPMSRKPQLQTLASRVP